MPRNKLGKSATWLIVLLCVVGAAAVWRLGGRTDRHSHQAGEVKEVRLTRQFGLDFLPLIVAEDQKLIEKHARDAGLGDIKTAWSVVGSGSSSADALLSHSVDFTSTGIAPLVTLWDKTNGEVKAALALGRAPMLLNTTNPNVKSIRDFTDKDKIALPAIKISMQAVFLEMAAAKEFGGANYAKLDPLTVSMTQPDGMAALLVGRSEVTAHFTGDPYNFQEVRDPRVRTVLDSYDVVGGPHTHVLVSTTKSFYDNNPKTYAAVVAAIEEGAELVRNDHEAAAEIYLRTTGSKESKDEILAELADPRISFDTTPLNVTKVSDFMFSIGAIRRKPGDWKELFFPNVHSRQGS